MKRILILVLALAACTSAPAVGPSPQGGGIRGIVTLGPTCPVEQVGQPPCETPYAAELQVTRRSDGTLVQTVRSGADGRFEVSLPPGDYTVTGTAAEVLPVAAPVDVTVEAGRFSEIEVAYDSGIR